MLGKHTQIVEFDGKNVWKWVVAMLQKIDPLRYEKMCSYEFVENLPIDNMLVSEISTAVVFQVGKTVVMNAPLPKTLGELVEKLEPIMKGGK